MVRGAPPKLGRIQEARAALTVAWKPSPRSLKLTSPMIWPDTRVLSVHDGDTITVDIDLGVPVYRQDQSLGFDLYVTARHLHRVDSVRFLGLDAPELSTAAGKQSRDALKAMLPVGCEITLMTYRDRNDKYGRLLGEVTRGRVDINHKLIEQGWAKAWDGSGPKPS